MGYDAALSKAWSELDRVSKEKKISINFLADTYEVDLENRRVFSLSCNAPAKVYLVILILHYLIRRAEGLPSVTGEWIDFRQLDGGQGYYPTFRKRVISAIAKKYGKNPEALLKLGERFKVNPANFADASIILETFENIPILIELWKADEEFSPEVNLLFDKSIKDILCTEDIVILSEFVAHNI